MTFDDFIETAWNDHGDRPQEVADRLAASLAMVAAPGDVAPLARIVTHVFGEHLGQWQRGVGVLEALQALPAAGDAAGALAAGRGIATLRLAGGDRGVLAPLDPEGRAFVLASAAAMFAGRGEFGQAIAAYGDALAAADAGLPPGSPALRALAVGGNNLAAALEQKTDRDAAATRGMIAAAEGALRYWRQAGTWLEEERALYRLARSRLQAGDAGAAMRSAQDCIDVCRRNDAPAFEAFFGFAVLAIAQRAAGDTAAFAASRERARQLYAEVPEDDRQWCASELEELGG